MSKVPVVELKTEQREVLEQWVRAHGTPQQVAKRCRIVLLAHQGHTDLEIADELGVNRHTCRLWRGRFMAGGPDGLWEVAEGRGRKPAPGLAERIVKATLETKPEGQTQWSTRTMAAEQGVDQSTVHRIWPLAEAPSALQDPLHAHQLELDEYGGALVCGAHRQGGAPRELRQCAGPDRGH